MSTALPLHELLENFEKQTLQTVRRRIALRRMVPAGTCIRFRRAATTGPNKDEFLVFVLEPGSVKPKMQTVHTAFLDQQALSITDEEVIAELRRNDFTIYGNVYEQQD